MQRPDSDTSVVEESCDAKESSTNEISMKRVTTSLPNTKKNIKITRGDVSQDTVCSWVAEGYGMSSLHYYEAISREIFRQTKLALEKSPQEKFFLSDKTHIREKFRKGTREKFLCQKQNLLRAVRF